MKKINRYVPELVLKRLSELQYKNKEHLYIICDMLYRVTTRRTITYDNDYIDIPTFYFTDIISDRIYYKEAMTFLISNNIIECDNLYSKTSGKAKGYRFNINLVSKLQKIQIEKQTLVKKIYRNKNSRNSLVSDILKPNKEYFMNTIHIDYDKAIQYINDEFQLETENVHPWGGCPSSEYIKAIHKYNSYFISISSIQDRDLYFTCNHTNNRVDTNLTSLKKELKRFIYSSPISPTYVGGNPIGNHGPNLNVPALYQIDIVNSQPLFLYYLLSLSNPNIKLKKEIEKYKHWVLTGSFYEMFSKEYFISTGKSISRDKVKKLIFTIFFCDNKRPFFKELNSKFKIVFPNIFQFIYDYKKEQHNIFAIDLTKLESSICIFKVVPELNKHNIDNYTIHDSWIIKKEDVEKTKEIIENIFYKEFGSIPMLKITSLNEEEIETNNTINNNRKEVIEKNTETTISLGLNEVSFSNNKVSFDVELIE